MCPDVRALLLWAESQMPTIAQLKSNEAPVLHEYTGAIQCVGRDLGLRMTPEYTYLLSSSRRNLQESWRWAGQIRRCRATMGPRRICDEETSDFFKVQGYANVLTH